jgi:hypothetical protein
MVGTSTDDLRRTYGLPDVYVPVFLDKDDFVHIVPLAVTMVSAVRQIDPIVAAFRSGGGVPWAAYGSKGRRGAGRVQPAAFAQLLGSQWLPTIPDLHSRLLQPGTRLLDPASGAAATSPCRRDRRSTFSYTFPTVHRL